MASTSNTISVAAVLLIIAGLFWQESSLVPQLRDATATSQANQQQIAASDQNITVLQSAGQKLQSAVANLGQQGIDRNLFQRVLPATEDLPDLYVQMEAVLASNQPGISGPTYSLGTPALSPNTADNGQATIPVTLGASGHYLDLKHYLAVLERTTRPVTFTSLGFSRPVAAASTGSSDPNTPATPATTSSTALVLTATGYFRSLGLSSAYSQP